MRGFRETVESRERLGFFFTEAAGPQGIKGIKEKKTWQETYARWDMQCFLLITIWPGTLTDRIREKDFPVRGRDVLRTVWMPSRILEGMRPNFRWIRIK